MSMPKSTLQKRVKRSVKTADAKILKDSLISICVEKSTNSGYHLVGL